ncbi:MAG TPA: HAMP domain-containing sensor histidine kinase, partial [Aggregatilineales bacterium]|nr:HAMP domain-containing sensor histidine kinase [Aggregatilineales bacterium]
KSSEHPNDNAVHLLRQMNHDMRNPLNALMATVTMLQDGMYDPLTAKQVRAVQRVERNGKRILALLDAFVTYMKADAGQYPVNAVDFEPRSLIAGVLAECQLTAQEKGLGMKSVITDSVPQSLHGDKELIQRIIQELAWNAISFSSAGTVELTSTWANDWQLAIKDSGPGIPAPIAPHVYEPFWKGETPGTTVPTSGSGLGLTVAHSLAKLMGGTITLKDTSAQGTEFVLTIPLPRTG